MTSVLPGVTIAKDDALTPRGPRLTVATVFLTGELTAGADAPIGPLRSMRELQRQCGPRTVDTAAMHDWLDDFWREGGGAVYVTPLRGPAAAQASHVFLDGAGTPQTAITVKAKTKGTDGNRTSVDIDVSGSTFEVKVHRDGSTDPVERSGLVAAGTDAKAWADTFSKYVEVVVGPGVDPVATAVPAGLTGGLDDFASITTTQIQAATDRFVKDLGPGSIVLPGRSSTAAQVIAQAHGDDRNRLARHEAIDTATASTVLAQAATLRAARGADIADLHAPRLNVPGLAPGSAGRTVSSTALRCAAEARNDVAGLSPNQAAAGRFAVAQYATAPTIVWSESDLADLNAAGVTVARVVDGELKVYGLRTLADPVNDPAGIQIGSARLRMAITEIVRFEGEQANFEEIDEGGEALGLFVGLCRSRIKRYSRSLFDLQVTAELVEDADNPGIYYVDVTVEFQAAPGAERVRFTIARAVTEV